MSVLCVFRCADKQTFLDKMAEAGVPLVDDDKGLRPADQGDFCPTPWLVTAEGSFVATVRVTPEQWALLPEVPPGFLCDYDSDTELDWPMYTVASTDINGNPVSYQQGAGALDQVEYPR